MTTVMLSTLETGNLVRMNSDPLATPEQVLGTCLRLELEAAALYRRFQAAASDPELVALWDAMSRAEAQHARLIDELASRRQFVPPAVSRDLLIALVARVDAIRQGADTGELDADRMLAIAAALEFSEMDDLFTAICQCGGLYPDEGRAEHLAPLMQAVLARQEGGGILRHLLAAMIRLCRRQGTDPSELQPALSGN